MKYIVCFSKGHSSALATIETVRKHGKENVILLNHNISSQVEHEDIKRFGDAISEYVDIPITYANMEGYEELTPIRVMKKFGGNSVGIVHCTHQLKTKPFMKWLSKNYPADSDNTREDIRIIYGFDANEIHRVQRRVGVMATQGYQCEFPLLEERTIYSTEEIGIPRPITYKIFNHANCIGCLKAGRQHWYVVYCLRPDIFREAVEAEKEIGYSIIKDVFMEELIPKYEELKLKGICPNDRENSQTFWAKVNNTLPEQQSFLPCDCAVL
jgi:hypothetical protein